MVAYAFQTAFGGEMWMWFLIVVVYSAPLILGGARTFLDKLDGWLLPIYVGGPGWLFYVLAYGVSAIVGICLHFHHPEHGGL